VRCDWCRTRSLSLTPRQHRAVSVEVDLGTETRTTIQEKIAKYVSVAGRQGFGHLLAVVTQEPRLATWRRVASETGVAAITVVLLPELPLALVQEYSHGLSARPLHAGRTVEFAEVADFTPLSVTPRRRISPLAGEWVSSLIASSQTRRFPLAGRGFDSSGGYRLLRLGLRRASLRSGRLWLSAGRKSTESSSAVPASSSVLGTARHPSVSRRMISAFRKSGFLGATCAALTSFAR